jgi:uncharacterized lipoprotein YehR (DUF1307 family)
MKVLIRVFIAMVLVFALAACGGGGEGDAGTSSVQNSGSGNDSVAVASSDDNAEETADSQAAAQNGAEVSLNDDFAGALSVPSQLALGIVQLEESANAIDEAQADELLPLWQAYQTLSQSDTTADIELQAVVNSIQTVLTPEQLSAIAEMGQTEDSLTALMESGEVGFARGQGRGGEGGGSGAGRGFGGGGGLPGGGPAPGGFGGGGPGGGGGFPGGTGGFAGGELSEDDLATRQAEFAENGPALLQDRLLPGMVIRLLEEKLGVESEGAVRGAIMNEAFTAVADEAGLSVEALQEQLTGGETMAAVVVAGGGDIDALQVRLGQIFSELPNAAELDLEAATAEWLGLDQ